ncbi:unnamed protein product [Dicrocoelium dendriticum]|nr:unnamed protein product [Dicrocoelium dendriticum]
MAGFSKLLCDVALDLHQRKNLLDDSKNSVNLIHTDCEAICVSLLKMLFIINKSRSHKSVDPKILLTHRSKPSMHKDSVEWEFRMITGTTSEFYTDLLSLREILLQLPSISAGMLYFFRSDSSIIDNLCFSFVTFLGDFGLSPKLSLFIRGLVTPPQKVDFSHYSETVIVHLSQYLISRSPGVDRFLSFLFSDLISEITIIDKTHTTAAEVDKCLPHDIQSIRPSPLHSADRLVSLLNLLFSKLSSSITLVPKLLIQFLGRIRHHFKNNEHSLEDLDIRLVKLFVDTLMIPAILSPNDYGIFSKDYLTPVCRKLLKQLALALRLVVSVCNTNSAATSQVHWLSTDIPSDQLLKQCNLTQLRAFFSELCTLTDDAASRYAGTNSRVTSKCPLTLPHHPGCDGFHAITEYLFAEPPVILLSITDLNILDPVYALLILIPFDNSTSGFHTFTFVSHNLLNEAPPS